MPTPSTADVAVTEAIKRQFGEMAVQLIGLQVAFNEMTARAEAAEAKLAELTKETDNV